jgi:hypothetical protein
MSGEDMGKNNIEYYVEEFIPLACSASETDTFVGIQNMLNENTLLKMYQEVRYDSTSDLMTKLTSENEVELNCVIMTLPPELLMKQIQHLDGRTVFNMMLVCKRLYDLIRADLVPISSSEKSGASRCFRGQQYISKTKHRCFWGRHDIAMCGTLVSDGIMKMYDEKCSCRIAYCEQSDDDGDWISDLLSKHDYDDDDDDDGFHPEIYDDYDDYDNDEDEDYA